MDLSTPTPPPGTFNPQAPVTPPPAPPEGVEEHVSTDPLDALLKQIIGGWFVLTDGQGTISKWSEPAELLFGKEAPEALGESFFETLLAGRIGQDADTYAAASLLLGACAQRAFAYDMTGSGEPPQTLEEFARGVARMLLRCIG